MASFVLADNYSHTISIATGIGAALMMFGLGWDISFDFLKSSSSAALSKQLRGRHSLFHNTSDKKCH